MLVVLETLQFFQVILIVFSGLLALAVMMVLGRMNYYERTRELATLKVLGFYPYEMKRLVLRENIWITIFELPFDYILGSLLLRVILKQATTPDLKILPLIAVFSIALVSFLSLRLQCLLIISWGESSKALIWWPC